MPDQIYKKDNAGNFIPVSRAREISSSDVRIEVERALNNRSFGMARVTATPPIGFVTWVTP